MTEVSSRYAKGLKFAAKPDVMSQVEFEVSLGRYRGSNVKMLRHVCWLSGPLMLGRPGFLGLLRDRGCPTVGSAHVVVEDDCAEQVAGCAGQEPTSGKPVWLDLKESDESGMGPHGMLTGQIGSENPRRWWRSFWRWP